MGYSTDRELSSYKEDAVVTRLQAELETERGRNKQLEEDLCLATKNIWSVVDVVHYVIHVKVNACFSIAQYPVRLTAQSTLHFLADLFIPTPTRLLREAF